MKVWRKFSVVALALVMVLAFGAVASAEGEATLSSGVAEDTTTPNNAISTSLNITKTINVHGNSALSSVYGPAITYSYAIAPANPAEATVTDGTYTRTVRQGVTGGVALTDANISISSTAVSLTGGAGTVSDTITVTVTPAAFAESGAGIYRYAITGGSGNESAAGAAGITRNGADDARFLDVYIKNNSAGTGLEVYGYVLLATNEEEIDSETEKSSKLDDEEYYTIDVSLVNTVKGNMGDKANQFSFDITVNKGTAGGFYTRKGTTGDFTTVTSNAATTTLANGETFYIYGLNPLATVTYKETNNTPDEYTIGVENATDDDNEFTLVDEDEIDAGGNVTTEELAVSTYTASNAQDAPTASDNSVVTFINSLEAISPTGVVLRYAPYLAMMGAGVVALPLSRRRKVEDF